MPDLFELTRVRPDPEDLPELDLPGLHRRARRRDRLRVAATTTLTIVVLGVGVVGIDRLNTSFGVPGVEVGPISPGQTEASADAGERIMLLERTWSMLAAEFRQATDSLAEFRARRTEEASERDVVLERILADRVERIHRELVEVERALVAEGASVPDLAAGAPHDLLWGAVWFGPSGDPVRTERLNVIRGSSHCDWQDILFLHVGWPLGSTGEPGPARQYVRDADGVLDERVGQPLDADTTLPAEARPTSHHTSVASLWLGPDDGEDAIYLIFGGHVERWPRADPPVVCG